MVICAHGEMVDARDLKSLVRKDMPVQVRLGAPMFFFSFAC